MNENWVSDFFKMSISEVPDLSSYLCIRTFERPLQGMGVNTNSLDAQSPTECFGSHVASIYEQTNFCVCGIFSLLKMSERLDHRACFKFFGNY